MNSNEATLMKTIKRIAFQSSLHVRAKDLGSKDSRHLETVHFMAKEAIAKVEGR